MTALRRHVPILWAIAILVMAGGQLLQAGQSFACTDDHGHEHVEAAPVDTQKSDSCPVEEHCCAVCISGSLILSEVVSLPPFRTLSQSYASRDESYTDGPRFEIDYPPQLS